MTEDTTDFDERVWWVTVGADEYYPDEIASIRDALKETLPDEDRIVVTPNRINALTPDEAESFARQLADALERRDDNE